MQQRGWCLRCTFNICRVSERNSAWISGYRRFQREGNDKYQNFTFEEEGGEADNENINRFQKWGEIQVMFCISQLCMIPFTTNSCLKVLISALRGIIKQLDAITDPFNSAFGHALDICLWLLTHLKSQGGFPAVSSSALILLLHLAVSVFWYLTCK